MPLNARQRAFNPPTVTGSLNVSLKRSECPVPRNLKDRSALQRHSMRAIVAAASGCAPRGVRTFRDQSAAIAPKQHFLSVDLTVKMGWADAKIFSDTYRCRRQLSTAAIASIFDSKFARRQERRYPDQVFDTHSSRRKLGEHVRPNKRRLLLELGWYSTIAGFRNPPANEQEALSSRDGKRL